MQRCIPHAPSRLDLRVQTNNGLSVGVNMAILCAIMVGTRALAFLFIYVLARLKRL